MTAKTGTKQPARIYIPGAHPREYEVVRGDSGGEGLAQYGRLKAVKTKVPKPWGDTDIKGALSAWFEVRSLFRRWTDARDSWKMLWDLDDLDRRYNTSSSRAGFEKDRQLAKQRRARRKRFDEALRKCVHAHGPLGMGNEIETMMIAVDDLRAWALGHDTFQVGRRDRRLMQRWGTRESQKRISDAITQCSFKPGVVEAPDLFCALAYGVHTCRERGIEFRVCAAPGCTAAFVANRNKVMCSGPCRERAKYHRRKAKKPTG